MSERNPLCISALALFVASVFVLGIGVKLRAQLPDRRLVDVPTSERDAITRLCRESGRPAPFREVRAPHLKALENRLRDRSVVAIDSEEALRLTGQPPTTGLWKTPYLVRALQLDSGGGVFTVHSCDQNLLVGYTAAPGSYKKMVRSARVVEVGSMPLRVFVTCGVGNEIACCPARGLY
jgi:hypothetical protein